MRQQVSKLWRHQSLDRNLEKREISVYRHIVRFRNEDFEVFKTLQKFFLKKKTARPFWQGWKKYFTFWAHW